MNYLQLAFRNILRHRKRTFVTVMTVCLGFTAIGVMGGMLNNIFSRLKAQAIVVEKLGHLTFAKEGFFENGTFRVIPEQREHFGSFTVNEFCIMSGESDLYTSITNNLKFRVWTSTVLQSKSTSL